jgi:hypothetical protein
MKYEMVSIAIASRSQVRSHSQSSHQGTRAPGHHSQSPVARPQPQAQQSTRSREGKREAKHRGKCSAKGTEEASDAVVTKGTKAKMASAGMVMCQYQGSVIQGFRSSQTKEFSPSFSSFFFSCNIPAHNANAAVCFRKMVQAIKMAPATYAPPNNAAIDDELLGVVCLGPRPGG